MEYTEATIQWILGKTYGIERGYITMPNVLLMEDGMYEADFIYINKNAIIISALIDVYRYVNRISLLVLKFRH